MQKAAPPFAIFEGWGLCSQLKPHVSSSHLLVFAHSPTPARALHMHSDENYSSATARVRAPVLASPDCGACTAVSASASARSTPQSHKSDAATRVLCRYLCSTNRTVEDRSVFATDAAAGAQSLASQLALLPKDCPVQVLRSADECAPASLRSRSPRNHGAAAPAPAHAETVRGSPDSRARAAAGSNSS